MKRKVAYFQDIPVDLANNLRLLTILNDWFANPTKSHQIITLNAAMLVTALRNLVLKEAIKNADLVTIDGYGILLALQKKGHQNLERFTGVDLTRKLLELCSRHRYPVYFFGGTPAVNQRMKEIIPVKWPGIAVSGIRDGYGGNPTRAGIIAEIRVQQPKLLLAGLGTPDQEIFLAEVLPLLSGTVGVGIGGTFEVLAGIKREAPRWVRNHGGEWCFRMLQEPRKLKLLPDLIRFWNSFLRK